MADKKITKESKGGVTRGEHAGREFSKGKKVAVFDIAKRIADWSQKNQETTGKKDGANGVDHKGNPLWITAISTKNKQSDKN